MERTSDASVSVSTEGVYLPAAAEPRRVTIDGCVISSGGIFPNGNIYPGIFQNTSLTQYPTPKTAEVAHRVTIMSLGSYFTVGELKTALVKCHAPNGVELKFEGVFNEEYEVDGDSTPIYTKVVMEWNN